MHGDAKPKKSLLDVIRELGSGTRDRAELLEELSKERASWEDASFDDAVSEMSVADLAALNARVAEAMASIAAGDVLPARDVIAKLRTR